MIKKQKTKITLGNNPYMYYMTNWGFIEQSLETTEKPCRLHKRS